MTRWRQFLFFLSVMGPGIITANIDNDASGITTYSVAGARFGYTLLWTLIPTTVALVVIQEMVARMAQDRGAKMFVPDRTLCIDNGAMIAWTGLVMHRAGVRMRLEDTVVNQRFRTDEVQVTWKS